jgi:trimeric autotransporter adhesin
LYKRIGERAGGALLVVIVLAFAMVGSGRASSTAVSVGSGSATVSGTSPATMNFSLQRSGDLGFDTWLHYQTEDGTAKAGTDYTAASGDVRMPAESSEKSIPVQVSEKSTFAPDQQFALRILSATGVGPTPSFADRTSFGAGGTVTGKTKVADLNGDGKADVIVPTVNAVSVLLNATAPGASTPGLAVAQSFAVGSSPEVATPADLNGDGLQDLVVTNALDDDFSVLLNTTSPGASTLSFAPQQVFEAGRGPRLPVIEDINSDGRPDLVLANNQFDEHAISVFINTTPPGASTASFQPRQDFEFFAPGFVLPADVNGDGRPDLIASSQAGADEVVVILNSTQPGASNLSLGSEADLPVGKLPNVVRAADVNGDGRPDLVVANNEGDSVSILLNGTAPGASTPSFAPQRSFTVGNEPRSIQAVDLNGDGRVDLIAGNHGNHSLSVLLNITPPGASAPSFAVQTVEAEPIPLGLVTADLNGDGRQDLIYTRESNKVLVSMNTTAAPTAIAPSLATKQDATVGGRPSAVAATDFNLDGRPDLVVANRDDDTTSVLLDTSVPGAPTPNFTAQQTFVAGNAPSSVATADFNHDGKPDLVIADELAKTASVLLGTTEPGAGIPSFMARQTFSVGEAPSAVATADFNGDDNPDIVVANHDENDVSVLFDTTAPGVTSPSFTAQQTFAVGDAPSAVTVADVNGDGKPDVIAVNHDEDTASVLLNTTAPGAATPSFAAQLAFGTDEHPSSVRTSDLNGDGKPDLVVANEGSDSASVLLNRTTPGASTPSFALPDSFEAGDTPSSVTIADLNGDGVSDLLVSNEGGDTASVLLNTTEPGAGTPSFADQQTFATGNGPTSVTTADLNGDGGPDVLTADGGADAISALLDTQYAASVSATSVTGTIHYAIPQVVLGPGSLAFGSQVVGSVATKTVTVSNTGGADLAIEDVGISAADVGVFDQTSSCPPTLATGSSCSIDVRFTPDTVSAAAAVLTVTSNAPTSPDSVALSGTGITPPAPTHMLTVELAGGGGGKVDGGDGAISCPSACSHAFADGSEVILTAIPTSGSTFAGWSRRGCAGASTCRVRVGSDTTVSAKFAKALPAAARLRIAKASAKGGASGLRISIRGKIAKGARGKVAVKARIRAHDSWVTVTKRAKITKGSWSKRLVLRAAADPGSPIHLSAKFAGSPGFRSAHVARRLSVR